MGDIFSTWDIVVFLTTLVAIMGLGLYAGRREDTSEDFFLAGRSVRWWGVAGSIFGSNVSANHLVGMMGIGYSVGFAQSHFEFGAIAGLMLLCYGFLPVYRKLRLYTLSEYLSRRYDDRSRFVYALIMIIVMVVVHMSQGFYIGSRSMNGILAGTWLEVGYVGGVLILAGIAALYTVIGGLKAVIITDVIQSLLLLAAGMLVAVLTFQQPEIGGWSNMLAMDEANDQKMRLYLPSDHAELPWTGALTGLMMLHFFYWGTNQFIVQRALGAQSDEEARLGIITAGFMKLLIPFFAIGTGIAAYYWFPLDRTPDPDTVFADLVRAVVPVGWGLVGLIAAGLIGAILSSIDSMMNSSATIVTMDIYRRYARPAATDAELILVGRLSIVLLMTVAALLAIFVLDSESKGNFFLQIVDQQAHLIPGLLVAFAVGMFWSGATATGAFVTIVAGPLISASLQWGYHRYLVHNELVSTYLGSQLNMLHRVAAVVVCCVALHVAVSLVTTRDREKGQLTWTKIGGHRPHDLRRLVGRLVASLIFFALLAAMVAWQQPLAMSSRSAAVIAAAWTMGMFVRGARDAMQRRPEDAESAPETKSTWRLWVSADRVWAGALCSLTIFLMFYFA